MVSSWRLLLQRVHRHGSRSLRDLPNLTDSHSGITIDIGADPNLSSNGTSAITLTLTKFNGDTWDFVNEKRISSTTTMPAQTIAFAPADANGTTGQNTWLAGNPMPGTGVYQVMMKYVFVPTATTLAAITPIQASITIWSQSNSSFAHQPLNNLTPAFAATNEISAVRHLGLSAQVANGASPLNAQGFECPINSKPAPIGTLPSCLAMRPTTERKVAKVTTMSKILPRLLRLCRSSLATTFSTRRSSWMISNTLTT